MPVNAGNAQVLAMRGVAELESVERVPAAEMHGEGARGHSHRLQCFVGLEVASLARQHSGDVFLHRHERGDEQMTIVGANLDGEIASQRRLASGVHLIGAANTKLGSSRLIAINLKLGPCCVQRQRRESRRFARCTLSKLCLARVSTDSQFPWRMQIPEADTNRVRKSSRCGCFASSRTSIAYTPQQE